MVTTGEHTFEPGLTRVVLVRTSRVKPVHSRCYPVYPVKTRLNRLSPR